MKGKGRYRESLGHFWNISKILKCFLKKNYLSSDSLKITLSVFSDFQKCFLKFAKHLIFIPKTLKSVFKGRNTFENHCQTGSYCPHCAQCDCGAEQPESHTRVGIRFDI